MATLAALRKEAKGLNVPKAMILRATTVEELQQIVDDFNTHDNGDTPPSKKAVAKKAVAKKKSSGNSKEAPQKKSGGTRAPAKSETGTAKRRGTAKPKSNGYVPKGGRNTLDNVDFNVRDGWNPRKGSAPEQIITALKKARGNRSKAFDFLAQNLYDFVGKKKQDGSKRNKAEAEEMLRYRISRTLFDFAIKTGQHESSTNRVQYGTGGTGEGIYKARKKPAQARTAKTAPKSKPKAKTAQKGAQSRAAAKKPAAKKARKSGRKAS